MQLMHLNRGNLRVNVKIRNKLNSSEHKMIVSSMLTRGSRANSEITVLKFKMAYFILFRVR